MDYESMTKEQLIGIIKRLKGYCELLETGIISDDEINKLKKHKEESEVANRVFAKIADGLSEMGSKFYPIKQDFYK